MMKLVLMKLLMSLEMLVGVVNNKYSIDFRYKIGANFYRREKNNSVVDDYKCEDVDFYCDTDIIFDERGRVYII